MWRSGNILMVILFASLGCSSVSENSHLPEILGSEDNITGYIYYNADIDVMNRHQVIDGESIVGSASLSYYSTPGAHDGDGGTNFVFKVLKEDVLTAKDKWIPFSNKDLEAYYIEWGSPAAYNWQKCDTMRGQFRIIEYETQKSLTMELNFDPKDNSTTMVKFIASVR